jgi:hypothetical protein
MIERFPDAPPAIKALPRDARGYPIPWFVGELNGAPDFRVLHPDSINIAQRKDLCWICGKKLGRVKTFVIGPMCAVNRVSSEPPSHRICATFAAQACPFLTRPLAKRRMDGLPEERHVAGTMIERNPGVTLLWGCLHYHVFQAKGGILFEIGAPYSVRWFAHGREATREEVMASIDSGLPLLRKIAEEEGPEALFELGQLVGQALKLVPIAA